MSIKIHHGPGGSYKTSGAISDDIIKVIKSGRALVTNVRGFSRELAIDVLGDEVHEDFTVIYYDTDLKENRDKFSRFFHWAPRGAFIFIDEAQRIWNPKSSVKDIAALAIPSTEEINGRPETLETAFDMHRHHNWDFVFTTTNIKKIHSIIRENAEFGYRHVNLALVGLKGYYKEVVHDSSNDGMSKSNQVSVSTKKIPKKVFKLYQSTSTGQVSDTVAGKPIWKDPKILALLLGLVGLWTYLLGFSTAPKAISGDTQSGVETTEKTPVVSTKNSSVTASNSVATDKSDFLFGDGDHLDNPYLSRFSDVFVTGSFVTTGRNGVLYIFSAFDDDSKEYSFNSDDLKEVGYYVKRVSDCVVDVTYNKIKHRLYCSLQPVDNSPVVEQQQESISNTFASNL